jgi:hypothetical protein
LQFANRSVLPLLQSAQLPRFSDILKAKKEEKGRVFILIIFADPPTTERMARMGRVEFEGAFIMCCAGVIDANQSSRASMIVRYFLETGASA